MKKYKIVRTVKIPDLARISIYQRVPELGPKLLFFSGGTALTAISQELKAYTYNSIHLVTPFDSGGSSAILRKAFAMPSIGDLRSRLMALADESVRGHPDIRRLFTYRLPTDERQRVLVKKLDAMIEVRDSRVLAIKNPVRRLICNHLELFRNAMPRRFDLRGASIGNLILAGGYLGNNKKLDSIVSQFSRIVGVQGTVRTVVNDNLHLVAELADKSTVIGQHLLTGKDALALTSPIRKLYLSQTAKKVVRVETTLPKKRRRMIMGADLICFPPGSFYSSVIANLLPGGVGSAIAANTGPKIYLPSLGNDSESIGATVADNVRVLLSTLRQDAGSKVATEKLLNVVLLDTDNGIYAYGIGQRDIRKQGVRIIDTPLISPDSSPYYDPQLVVSALLSLT